jgi:hypothetical protein
MMIKPFDQFNKKLFQQLLSPYGTVTPNRSVMGGERTIDILFEPAPGVEPNPEELGNLANMTGQTSLFEAYRSNPSDYEIHTCFLNLFLLYAELQRQSEGTIATRDLPQLWILAAEASEIQIREFSGVPDPEQGEGFYRLASRLRTTIVVIDELPTTADTLWLRLLGKGRTQEAAIAELLMQPDSTPRRGAALDLLVSWRISMEVMEEVGQEERRILMALSQAYLEWEQQTQQRGIEQGIERAIASILSARFGSIDEELAEIMPALSKLPIETVTPLLLQLTREELLQRFSSHPYEREDDNDL